MTAIDFTLCAGGIDGPLDGPDLKTLPPLAAQIAALDEVKALGDVEEYVFAWLAVSDANGGGASAFWSNSAAADEPAEIMVGVICDAQERDRRDRWAALREHHQDVSNFRAVMQHELVERGRFSDNRRASPIEIKAVVRAFLATGGRLLIDPSGKALFRGAIRISPDAERFLYRNWSHADSVATKAMLRLSRRHRAQPTITRIIKTLGHVENGWTVLGRKQS